MNADRVKRIQARLKSESEGLSNGSAIIKLEEPKGAGTELKRLIARLGLKPGYNCKCNQHIREMNQKGVEWCQQNIKIIVGWLKEEAARAGLPFIETAAKIMIRRAITNAKKELLTSQPK